jgi:hypothetical protein
MRRENCLLQLLCQLARAAHDGQLPSATTLANFTTFISNLEVLEASSKDYALEALTDWVPRLLQGIADSALQTVVHPPVLLQSTPQQSTPYMDLMVDAIATVPFQSAESHTEARYKIVEVVGYKILNGSLSYWVMWEGDNFHVLEKFGNIHHLDIFKAYERSITPPVCRARGAVAIAAQETHRRYMTFRDKEASTLIEEYDTEDDDSQEVALHPTTIFVPTPLDQMESEDSMSWGSLLVEEDGFFLPSNLDLGGTFGEAGPSYQGELFDWGKLDKDFGAPGH